MDVWTLWLDAIRTVITASADVGLGVGLAIIVVTLLLRTLLLPLAWPVAYRACLRQRTMRALQPELQALRDKYRDNPAVYLEKMKELHEKHGLAFVDLKGVLGSLVQLPVFLGMYQALRDVGAGARFLWVPNLLRPDVLLAVIAGLTTALMMSVNPDMPEQLRIIMIVLPSIVAIVAALHFSSALAIYWATSNTFSALQTATLHVVVRRRLQLGAIKI
jgi:YidC/Oxa1 family membrane protein insertase